MDAKMCVPWGKKVQDVTQVERGSALESLKLERKLFVVLLLNN